jgi:homoserine dehydrogenase
VAVREVVTLGILGCGTVGSALLRLLHDNAEDIARRSGRRFEVLWVGVREGDRARDVPVRPEAVVTDLTAVVRDPQVQVVVELIGGLEPARSLLHEAMVSGKHVVTANKELVAAHGEELFERAAEAGVDLLLEGAVGGGIPLVRPLRESLAGERVARILGIVNGTTNYVLTRMTEEGSSFPDALARAQELGFAERDPTDDVEGHDAAAKCAILASMAFDTPVVSGDVYREGIARVTPEDVEFARRIGYVIKPLAIAELADGDISARVHPTMLPQGHPLAAVRDAFNAVFVEGERVGELMFYGRGAGGEATAVSVAGDLVAVGRTAGGTSPWSGRSHRLRAIGEGESAFYLLLDVVDRPGVLAKVAGAFGAHQVSIKSVWQEGTGEEALLVLITHRANEAALQRTVGELRGLEVVAEVRSVMRVAGVE